MIQLGRSLLFILFFFSALAKLVIAQNSPDDIKFVRQGVKRLIFNQEQSIPLAVLEPENIVGMASMHPVETINGSKATINNTNGNLYLSAVSKSTSAIWLGGFNPFATYTINLESFSGIGEIGFEFTDVERSESFVVAVNCENNVLTGAKFWATKGTEEIVKKDAATNISEARAVNGKLILQMVGSGFILYHQSNGLPIPIGQGDFNTYIDLRAYKYLQSFHSNIRVTILTGEVTIGKADVGFSTGSGQADIRAITYEDGEPLIDQGRLWFTMSIRGRGLPHHIQGVFSLNPAVFDIKLKGIIVFDRNDGILRNEIASHIFYDRNAELWRGLTTGFSAFANPEKEKKQLLAVESIKDPRFGFSVMTAKPFGMVGDIEDPHIIYDNDVQKWRMFVCENINKKGYKAIMMESDSWDKDFVKIAGPVKHNSTGTSIQKIGDKRFCFSGSSERKIFVYTYPDLKELEPLKMDLPPWDDSAGTRVWPNVVQLPDGYFCKYIALMMDRYNYPGLKGPNWTYGALYLYHGYD